MLGLKQFFKYLPALSMLVFMASCAEESGHVEDQEDVVEIGSEEEVVVEDQVHHQVPSPHEMMEFIKASGSEFNANLLCQTSAADKYVDLKGKSMGMGIFIADLAYASSYSQFQEAVKYFDVVVKMSEDVGISGVFDEAMMENMKTNLDHPDSLEAMTSQSYYEIIAELEGSDRGKVVAMIAAGGFLESLFIGVQSVQDFQENDPVIKRIADQKLIYENIMMYLEKYKDDQNVEWTIQDMSALKNIFDEVSDNRRDTKFSTGENGKTVLGGTGGVYITEQEFEVLKDDVTKLRDMITFNFKTPE